MDTFFSFLEKRVNQVNTLLCVGLDPHKNELTDFSAESVKNFCLRIIAATADLAAAYKPNIAFFEALGSDGIAVLRAVIDSIPDNIPVLLDAKRGDVASTAEAYAYAAFNTLKVDAITLNPYMGRDSIEPFIKDARKGVFLLCKTSNPGASDLQDLLVVGSNFKYEQTLYERIATLAQEWNENDNLGLVVGATQITSLERVRAVAQNLWILAPGIGAQGGDLRAALRAGLRADGLGMLIPVSRAIAQADDPAKAARNLRDAINHEREVIANENHMMASQPSLSRQQMQIADSLLIAECIHFGSFTLKSGLKSPIYIDLRRLVHYPALLAQVAKAYIKILKKLTFDHLAALPYAALPIATAISLDGNYSMLYPRKEVKTYGTKALIEGVFTSGQRVVIIDDLITSGGSKFEGIEKLITAGLIVQDVVVLIDRQAGGVDVLAERGYQLHVVLTMPELLNYYEQSGKVSAKQASEVRKFMSK